MRVVKRWVSKGAGNREGEYTELVETEAYDPMPKQQLLSIAGLLGAVASASEGEVTVPELADALSRVYDPETMMIYDASGYGLASPIGDDYLGSVGGYNKRADVVCDLFNSRFWDASYIGNVGRLDAKNVCVSKTDGVVLARSLWKFFFPDDGTSPSFAPLSANDATCIRPQKGSANELKPEAETHPARGGIWPWGTHHTKALGHLEAAALRFWKLYDPADDSTAPTNNQVSEWLQTERGLSQKMAEAMASILRADGLPTGPRK